MSISPVTSEFQARAQFQGAAQSATPQPAAAAVHAASAAPVVSVSETAVKPVVDLKKLQQALDDARSALKSISLSSLSFSIDASTDRTVVKVIDESTGDLIRQIPSQEMLDLAHRLDQFAGVFLNRKA